MLVKTYIVFNLHVIWEGLLSCKFCMAVATHGPSPSEACKKASKTLKHMFYPMMKHETLISSNRGKYAYP